jgi:hypothetical protein
MMIAESKLPHPRRLEGLALLGSTHSYHFVATKKNAGADPSSAGDEKEANAKRVKGEPCVPKLDPNTRQRKGDLKW